MSELSFSKELTGDIEKICEHVTEAIKTIGFGVLTRIDFDKKIEEKLGEKINRTIILGACNPKLALEAYKQSTDVALLIPCNIVLRETGFKAVIVEAMRPSMMLSFLSGVEKSQSILKAEDDLKAAVMSL